MHRFPARSTLTLTALLSALMVVGLMPASVSAATRPITISVVKGDHCLYGRASDDAVLQITWKDANGNRKLRVNDDADGSGHWDYCSTQNNVKVETGDWISAKDVATGETHLLIVPTLTAFGNRVRDVYKGFGPAGNYIKLICAFSNGFEPCQQTWRVRVSNEGKWSLRPGWDVGAGETIAAQWKSAAGDFVRAIATPPILTVRIGSPRVVGETRSGSALTVVLKRGPALDVRATANLHSSPFDGAFAGPLKNQAGSKVNVRPGDLISSDISADLQWVVPDIQATSDSQTGNVDGRCDYDDPLGPQQGDFEVRVFRNGEFIDRSSIVDSMDEEGFFNVVLDFQLGDQLVVRCGMSTGDWAEKMFTAI
jgi:hypothetical protein